MANPNDVLEAFPITQNAAGVGVAVTAVQPGSSASGNNAVPALVFQDANGNLIAPQLNNLGQLPVTLETSGQRLRAHGRAAGVLGVTGANDYANYQTIISIAAVAASGYGEFGGKVSCRRGAFFELVYQDSVNSVVLDSTIVDAGQYTAQLGLGPSEDLFNVPASASAPAFVVRGINFGTVSDLHATLAVTSF